MAPAQDNHKAEAQQAPVPSLEDFRADLEVFSGPLDLLLHLVKREEVDVLEVPVSRITEQYLQTLRGMEMLDVNVAAEFLVMAATLMDLKSRTLLPETVEAGEEPDPRDELVRQLLQYRRFKDASRRLRALGQRRSRRFSRPVTESVPEPRPVSMESLLAQVSIWDLVSAYSAVVRQIETARPAHIVYDDIPVADYMEEVMARVAGREAEFLDFFRHDGSRSRVIGIFLALLELVRQRRVVLHQPEEENSRITITAAQEDHGSSEKGDPADGG
jgi:segregation and condensation protein A